MKNRFSVKGLRLPFKTVCEYVDNCLSNKEYRKVFKAKGNTDWETDSAFTVGDLMEIVPEAQNKILQKIKSSRLESSLEINVSV